MPTGLMSSPSSLTGRPWTVTCGPTFTVRAFADAVAQTLEGLIAAHHADLIHRDLKHSNIMVVRLPSGALQYRSWTSGWPFVSRPTSQTMHGSKSIYGTVYFLAPEQIRHDHAGRAHRPLRHGLRLLLHALGQARVRRRRLHGHHHQPHGASREAAGGWRPDIPAAVCDWVMKLISSDPADRFVSAVEALTEFRRIDAQRATHTTIKITPVMVGKPPAPPPPAAPRPRPCRPPRPGAGAGSGLPRRDWCWSACWPACGWATGRSARSRRGPRVEASVTLPSGARAEVGLLRRGGTPRAAARLFPSRSRTWITTTPPSATSARRWRTRPVAPASTRPPSSSASPACSTRTARDSRRARWTWSCSSAKRGRP